MPLRYIKGKMKGDELNFSRLSLSTLWLSLYNPMVHLEE
ncbi:hypothetical protein PCIT_a4498 [Pseudoalteromonas citrea]|uniref:Uncharacterized protein n=1 Tax=Pseudoalteromonas citrea TaxID=43655 RepID=A0AAD4AG24_9GAMM|nr:hypothetical protein PCIT_a4498 [Pseudoalteromonas citrea]